MEECRSHDNGGHGVSVYNGSGTYTNMDLHSNGGAGVALWDTGRHGVSLHASHNPRFEQCTIHDNKGHGVNVIRSAARGKFVKCHVHGNAKGGVTAIAGADPSQLEFEECDIQQD